jgi:subtilase family serine protease
VTLAFVGANPGARPRGRDATPAVFSYFSGPRAQWKKGVATYGAVVYEELWPGIDMVYDGAGGRLKYSFVLKPGADPRRIRLAYHGATGVRITPAGELRLSTPVGGFSEATPYSFQEIEGRQVEVTTAYEVERAAGGDGHRFGFRLGAYDRTRTLVLDPATFVYVGYIGGSDDDRATGVAVDSAGNAYVTGLTESTAPSFPAQVGPELTHAGGTDVFVAKVRADGTGLVYAGFIGGDTTDIARGIAVDAAGNAYVTGQTFSTEATFPVTVGPRLTYAGTGDAFVAKVSADGTTLVYCGYIGGSDFDTGAAIAVDANGHAVVTGNTQSTETTFPVAVGPGLTFRGDQDAFVAKVSPDGTGLVHAGYIGGAGVDGGTGIALDAAGNAVVVGTTESNQLTFPVLVGPGLTHSGRKDAFVAKVSATGAALLWAGYIGGGEDDEGAAVALDTAGNAYVAGTTESDESTLPVAVGPSLTHVFDRDVFVAKVRANGTALVYAGYIGGTSIDEAHGIAVDRAGNAYVAGVTFGEESFPQLNAPPFFSTGIGAAFVSKVRADGGGLAYSALVAGSGTNEGRAVAVDSSGNAYVVGETSSTATTFPVLVGPGLTYGGGFRDAFIAKITTGPVAPDLLVTAVGDPPATVSPGTVFPVSVTVQNQGLVNSAGSVVRLLFSFDTTQGAGDTLLTGQRSIGVLVPGGVSTGTVNVTVPAAVQGGFLRLLACADFNTTVVEMEETNNCTVAAAATQVILPDLAVTALTASATLVRPGQTITVTDTTTNGGTVSSAASVTNYRLSGGQEIGIRNVAVLAAGAGSTGSRSVTIPTTVAPGSNSLSACADSAGSVSETSEGDNCRSVSITVALPNLALITLTHTPAGPFTPGGTITVTDQVTNPSTIAIGVTTIIRYYLSLDVVRNAGDVAFAATRTVPNLAPGAQSTGSTTLTIPGGTPAATYFLLACADDAATVTETLELDNCRISSSGTVGVGQPNLVSQITSFTVTAPLPRGGLFTLGDTTTNAGTGAVGRTTTTRYVLSADTGRSTTDTVLLSRTVANLAPAGTSPRNGTLAIPATMPPGQYFLLVCADDARVVVEANEVDNCAVSATRITVALPDLTTSNVSVPPGTLFRQGQAFTISDRTRNIGVVPAPATTTRYWLSLNATKGPGDRLLTGASTRPAIPAGGFADGTRTVTIPSTTPIGVYFLLACADDLGAAGETSETNNCTTPGQIPVTP